MNKRYIKTELKFSYLPSNINVNLYTGVPKIEKDTWVDISPITDSRSASIQYQLVDSSLRSAISTASISIKSVADYYGLSFRDNLFKAVMASMENSYDIHVQMSYGGTAIFSGVVDTTNFSISSSSVPKSYDLTFKDNSFLLDRKIASPIQLPAPTSHYGNTKATGYSDLDALETAGSKLTKGYLYYVKENSTWYRVTGFKTSGSGDVFADVEATTASESGYFLDNLYTTVTEVTRTLLAMAGYDSKLYSSGTADYETSEYRIRSFCYDTDGKKTYRDRLDTLLSEHGLVIIAKPDGTLWLMPIPATAAEITNARNVDAYLYSQEISTSFSPSDADGIAVTWAKLAAIREQVVYNFTSSLDQDTLTLQGEEIQAGQYWPESGAEEPSYLSYDASFLDRKYQTGETKVKDGDISIISTAGHAIAYGITNKDSGANYEFPTIEDVGLTSNPLFYPKKAQVLIHNKGKSNDDGSISGSIYLQYLQITADVLYRSDSVEYMCPTTAQNPKEYTSEYIFTEDQAKRFASIYADFQKYSRLTTEWSERSTAIPAIGEVVNYTHKDTSIASTAKVTRIKATFTGSLEYPFILSYHAVGCSGYNSKPVVVKAWPSSFSTAKQGPKGDTGASGTSVTISSIKYQAGASATTAPTGTWSDNPVSVSQGQYLWTKTTYSDGKIAYGVARQGEDGKTGTSPAILTLDSNSIQLDAYADGPVKSYDGAAATASVSIEGTVQTGWTFSIGEASNVSVSADASSGTYTVTELSDDKRSGFFTAVATNGTETVSSRVLVSKLYDTGTTTATASASSFVFYADNVPHNSSDSITITVALSGYSPSFVPTCTLGGKAVTLTNGKYIVGQSTLSDVDSITFTATGLYDSSSVVIRKVMDVASMSLSVSRTVFGYYADGFAHTGETPCVATIIASGLSTPPTIKVGGIAKTLTAAAPKYTLTITNSDLADGNVATLVEATYGDIVRGASLVKSYDTATITLNLTHDFFNYYADNVAYANQSPIVASIIYSGLYDKPVMTVNGTVVTLDADNSYSITADSIATIDSIVVSAYSSHIDTYALSATRVISKHYAQPSISLVASATQFHQANDGSISPGSITVTPKVDGLSPSASITYEWGTDTITLTGGSYTIPSSDVETYKSMTASWRGTVYDTLTIIKVVDGKSMTYMYAQVPEGWYPCEYPFGIDQNAIGMADTAIGINFAWMDTVPDIAEGYVLWTKTTAPDGTVSIYRVQGPKGEPGEAGPQGPKGESEGTYLGTGTSTTIPTKRPDESDIAEGDFYLDISNTENPIPFEMKNGKWTAVDGSSAKWSVVASAVQGDVAKYCPNISNSNGLYGFFKNLSAVNGFVDGLGTRSLALTSGGELKSEEWDTSGGTEGFYLPSDGNAVFNTGTFQGGIANGWTIFGGLQMEIPATMTQKELYSALRKAGVGSGAYMGVGPLANAELFNEEKAYSTKNMLKGFTQRFTHVVCSENLVSLQPLVSLGTLVTTVGKGYFLTMEQEGGSSRGEYTYTVRLLSPSDVDTLSGIGILHKNDSLVDNNGGGSVGTDVTSTFAYVSNAAVPVAFPHAYWHDPDNNKSYGLGVSKVYIFDSSSGSMVITSHDIICYDTDGSTVINGASAENTIISWYDSQHIRRCTWGGKTVWLYTFEDGTGATNHAWIAYSEDMVHWTRISGTTITKAVVVSDTETQTTGYTCPLAYNGILYYFRITCDTVTTTETSGTTTTVKGTYTVTTRFCSRPASNLSTETVIHAVTSIKDSNIEIGKEIPVNSYAAINTCCMDASDNGVIAYTLGGVALPSSRFGYFFISDTNSARMYFYDTVAKKTTSKVFRKLGRCVFTLFYLYKLICPTITRMVSDIQWDGKASKFVIVTSSSMLYMMSDSQNIGGATSVLYMDEDGGNVSVKQFTDTALVQLPDYRLTSVYHDGYDLWVPLDPASFGGLVVTQTPIQGSVTQHAPINVIDNSYSIDDVWLDSSDTDVVSSFGLDTQIVQFRWDQEAKKYYMNISGGVTMYCFLDASDKMENVPQITIDGNSTELVPFSCERFYLRPTLSSDSNAIMLADMYNTRYGIPS